MSFFGGGTDFSGFYDKHGGAVISTTFDKYCYVTVRHLPPFFDYKTHLTYSKEEKVFSKKNGKSLEWKDLFYFLPCL